MRLRPSGESGMLAASCKAFRDYQLDTAWTWEHQALVRARFVCGDPAVGEYCGEVRREVLSQARDKVQLARDVVEMRQRMRGHLLPTDAAEKEEFHLKHGYGGIVDIEFMVQYAVLAWSHRFGDLTIWSDNIRILESLQLQGLFSEQESQSLIEAYIAYRSVAHQQALQQQPGVVDDEQFVLQRDAVTAKWKDLLGAIG
jgi:glutamate-ammonia-ligase adenylyltransferase